MCVHVYHRLIFIIVSMLFCIYSIWRGCLFIQKNNEINVMLIYEHPVDI